MSQAAANVLQQQAGFDDFITRYNADRPHQALGMKVPAEFYARSARVYRGLEELTYPFHDHTVMVTGCGRITIDSSRARRRPSWAACGAAGG